MKDNIFLTEEDQTFLVWLLDNYTKDYRYYYSSKEEAISLIHKIESI